MPDYSYGKIYKIWTDNSDDVYIGSTVETVSMRMAKHRARYKRFLKTGKGYYTSFIILEQGNIHYKLIEKYPCENRQQLHKREGHWQKKMTCVNDKTAGRTYKEYYLDNKLKILKKNKEKILKRINEKNICICCDGRYTTGNWTKHSRTKKHVKAQKLQEQLQDLIPLYHQ